MNLTAVAIAKNRVTLVLVGMLLVAGASAYFSLPKAQDPGFTVRAAVITTLLPGASPERVELLVTDQLEEKIQEMPEVEEISSESRTGISIITVEFKESYKIMRPIFDDMRRKVDDVTGDLPEGVRGPFVNDEFGDVFGSVYALTGDGFSYAELKDVADEIRDRLLREPDVAKVTIHGAQDEVIYVEYSNARLTELGLSPPALANALAGANILSSGGNILSGRERIVLEPTGNLESVEELSRTVLQTPGGGLVYLGDIAEVRRAYVDPPDNLARVGGADALALAVSMRDGGDMLKLGARLRELMPAISATYPWGIKIEEIWFQADLVTASVNDFLSNLGQAIAIVVVVMIGFLGIRTGLIVASLIPTTMIITFFVMQIFDITINQISLAALIIALGLLVDNAIVVVESVLVKRQIGIEPVAAAIESGAELRGPLLISSLTTAAAFMPIALAESAVGEYTADIFYVVSIALLLSWTLAMTLVPMLTVAALPVPKVQAHTADLFAGRWYTLYRRALLAALRHRAVFFVAVIAIFVLAIRGLGLVPAIFIAPSNDPVFTGKFEMPLGTSIETSRANLASIDRFIRDTYAAPQNGERRIDTWLTFIGDGGPRFTLGLDPPKANPANSFLIARTTSGEVVDDVIDGIEEFVTANYPDMAVQLSRLENGPPVGYPIVVRLSGPEFAPIFANADQVTDALYDTSGVTAVKNTWGLQTKKLLVDVDQERARRSGVTSDDVAYSLRASLSGIELTEYREGDQIIPVTLRTIAADREDIGKLDGLTVFSKATGSITPLKQVADIRLVFEPGVIERRSRARTLSLKTQIGADTTATTVTAELLPKLQAAAEDWPADYQFEVGGETEESDTANASIAAKLPLALMVILVLLVGQFNSVRRPIIVLATIPLGLIGVTIGLLVARSSFGFFTILGIISLAGIIINNAIVLLDRIRIEVDELGRSPQQAIVMACQHRLRPILLTTATTVLGMMPLWWGGTDMFKPLAISIIFGLAFATLLTLLVVPTMYSALFRVSFEDYVDAPAESA